MLAVSIVCGQIGESAWIGLFLIAASVVFLCIDVTHGDGVSQTDLTPCFSGSKPKSAGQVQQTTDRKRNDGKNRLV